MFVADWWAMSLPNNAVSVSAGFNSEVFIRLPSGAFNPPPASNSKLTQTGQRTGPYGGAGIQYEYGSLQFNLVNDDGSQINFVPNFVVWTEFPGTVHGMGRKDFRATSWTFPTGVTLTYNYPEIVGNPPDDYAGCLESVENNLGRELNFSYTHAPFGACRLDEVSDESGRTFTWATTDDLPGTIVATSSDGKETRYEYPGISITSPKLGFKLIKWFVPSDSISPFLEVEYDQLNRVSHLTDARNFSSDYFIGSLGYESLRRGEKRDPLGAIDTAYFGKRAEILQSIDPLGRTTYSEYDSANRLESVTYPEGNAVEYDYDIRHNLVQTTYFAKLGSGDASITTSAIYPATCANPVVCNLPTSTTDARGNPTSYTYNSATGQVLTITYPAVAEGIPFTSYEYQSLSTTPSISALFKITERITSTPSVKNLVTAYNFNPANKYVPLNVIVDSGGLNFTTTYEFDAVGNVSELNGPRTDVTDVTSFQWDSRRRASRIDGQLGASTKFSYDVDGQLFKIETWDNIANVWRTETREYWETGDTKEIKNAEGHATTYDYDALGRLTYLTVPVTSTTTRVTRSIYDLAGQKTAEYRGWGTTDQIRYGRWGYTANGQADWSEDAVAAPSGQTTSVAGRRTNYDYDGHDRLRRMYFPSTTIGVASTVDYEEYGYDANSNLVSNRNRDAKVITTPVIDAMNRERTLGVPANASGNYARTVTTTYDLLGRTKTMTAEGQTLTFAYDEPGRLTSVIDSVIGTTSYQYDEADNRTRVTWPGTAGFVAYTYDAVNRVDLVRENGTSLIADYSWDSLSRIQLLAFGNSATSDWSYFQDSALQSLVHAVPYSGGSRVLTIDYGRDRSNFISTLAVAVTDPSQQLTDTQLVLSPVSSSTTGYVPNHLNQYSSVGGTAYTYDGNGNLQSDGVRTFAYDEENRLRTANGAGNTVTYDYDPLGRRRAKTVNGTVTRFLSDGAEEIGEYSNTNALLRRYVYGPSIDELLVQIEAAGARSYIHSNHLGSTVMTSSATGAVTPFRYDGYGNSDNALTGLAFRYAGRRLDPETELYYFRSRNFSPKLGRFLQPDPIGFADCNPLTIRTTRE